jgi:hypothetical protein
MHAEARYVELSNTTPYVDIVQEFETKNDVVNVIKPKRHMLSFLVNALTLYDGRTMTLIALQYFSEGAMFMICLTSTIMFSSHFQIGPARATLWLALVCLPEGLIFVYGMIADTVTLFDSPRRFYICVMALVQLVTATVLARTHWLPTPQLELQFALLVSICVLSRAWLTPVIESLMLIQMKRDPDYGADDLETFGLLMTAFGTIFYCVLGGELIKLHETTPQLFFWLIASTGAMTFLAGLWYPT